MRSRLLLALLAFIVSVPALALDPGPRLPSARLPPVRGDATIEGGVKAGGPISGSAFCPDGGCDGSKVGVAVPGGVARALSDIEVDRRSVRAYRTINSPSSLAGAAADASAAAAAAGGGVVQFPAGTIGAFAFSQSTPDPRVVWEIDGPNVNRSMVGLSGVATDSGKVFHGLLSTSRPSGNNRAGVGSFFLSQGSGKNGAQNADFAHGFFVEKLNWQCTVQRQAAGLCTTLPLQGEIDTLYLNAKQGGPDATSSASLKGAAALMTGQTECVGAVGFCAHSEFKTITYDPTSLAVTGNLGIQQGAINTRPAEAGAWGTVYNAIAGQMTSGLLFQHDPGARWNYLLRNIVNGLTNYTIDDTGEHVWSNGGNSVRIRGAQGVLGVRGAIGSSTTPAWASGQTVSLGDVRSYNGAWYSVVSAGGTTAAGSEPTATAGAGSTGADGITWAYGGPGDYAALMQTQGGKAVFPGAIGITSLTPTQSTVSLLAAPGSPEALVPAAPGSLALRTLGGVGRSGYLKESGTSTSNTGWNPIVTASQNTAVVAAGTTQATATALAARVNVVSSVPQPNAGVVLSGVFRDEQIVFNRGGNTLMIYPPTGGAIDSNSTNAAVSVAPGGRTAFFCVSATLCLTSR